MSALYRLSGTNRNCTGTRRIRNWVPAFAGMTKLGRVIPIDSPLLWGSSSSWPPTIWGHAALPPSRQLEFAGLRRRSPPKTKSQASRPDSIGVKHVRLEAQACGVSLTGGWGAERSAMKRSNSSWSLARRTFSTKSRKDFCSSSSLRRSSSRRFSCSRL